MIFLHLIMMVPRDVKVAAEIARAAADEKEKQREPDSGASGNRENAHIDGAEGSGGGDGSSDATESKKGK